MSVRDVLVVGAGIAGLACALACARAGARVRVLEASPADAPIAPALHVDLVPSLLRDLDGLGVARDCVGRGFAYNRVAVVDERGRLGFELPIHRLGAAYLPPAAGIELGDFLSVLAAAAQRSGVAIHRGQVVRAIDAATGRVEVAGGSCLDADLVVLATGAESPLVAELFESTRQADWPHEWWYAMVARPAGLDQSTLVAGLPGRRLFVVPTGMSRAGVAVLRSENLDEPVDFRTLARTLMTWGPLARQVATSMTPETPTVRRRASGAPLIGPWHRGAVLCVGAAAHRLAPMFGQDSAQAVEDAVVLGELVAAAFRRETLLTGFTARRGERVTRVHALAERATRWISRPDPTTDLLALAGEITALVATPA